jgi:NAD(P)-dependent dehydrogenase (short-subunit alcohol dehydrogenase family)
MHTCREAGRNMGAGDSILTVSSIAGAAALPHVPAYSAAKAEVIGLTRTLAVECGPRGIRVNCIASGFVVRDADTWLEQPEELACPRGDADGQAREARARSRSPCSSSPRTLPRS